MADISMCTGKNCKMREKCYRFTAIPSEYWQSYFVREDEEVEKCHMFWNNKGMRNREDI